MTSSAELFRPQIDPGWLPDETLFSLCSRIHRLSCNILSSTTTRQLFGHARCGVEHDFPSNLAALALRSGERWGNTTQLVLDRTIFPFYLAFHPPEVQAELRNRLLHPGLGHLKFRLGLLTSRFGANHPLKACPDCIATDQQAHGVAYWHRSHQIPGVWVCSEHQALLQECSCKANGIRRFDWLLPDEANFVSPITGELPNTSRDALAMLAVNALQLTKFSRNGHLALDVVSKTYRARALSRFGLNALRKHAWTELSESYARSNEPFVMIRELSALPHEPDAAMAELQRLLRYGRGRAHPLRHLAVIHWLFDGWSDFLNAYQNSQLAADHEPSPNHFEPAPPSERRTQEHIHLVELVTADGMAPSRAAAIIGIDTATAIAWLAQAGIASRRRPKKLQALLRASIIRALSSGADKRELSDQYALSVATITTILRTEPGLHERWKQAREAKAREQHRETWSNLLRTQAAAGIKALRHAAPMSYAWLYRNDRAWLLKTNTHVPSARRGNNHQTDWAGRDDHLAKQVRALANQLRTSEGQRLRQWQLTQALPELRAKLGQLHRLPMTRQALIAATADPRVRDLFD